MSAYHRLRDIDEEADELWDQLNDAQAQEVQRHQSRFEVPDARSRTNRWVILRSMMWNTAIRTGASISSAWVAAREAWQRHPISENTDTDFDLQFGIDDLRHNSSAEDNEERPNPGYPFVVLKNYPSRRAVLRDKDEWGIVANIDVFLVNLYSFYYHRGMVPLICKFLLEFVSLLFTLFLSRLLLDKVNWKDLISCTDEHTCKANWSDYYYQDQTQFSPTYWWLLQGYTTMFVVYIIFSVWRFWQTFQQALQCQFIMHEKLGISRRKLQGGAVSWDEVIQKLIHAQDSGTYRTTLNRLDSLIVAQRIMRKDNFFVAFWNQGLLDVKIGNRNYWCPTLEWSIHFCILSYMFNHKYELRPAFLLDATALKRRLFVCGVLHAIFLPFLIIFVLFHFLLQNVYDFKTQQQYMGNKQWSTVAHWLFREFNELPHVMERRLSPSYEASEEYLKLFGQSEYIAAIGKLFSFVGGALGGVLLLLGVLNDAILLHVQLWERNLLWYVGMSGLVYSVGQALIPSKEAQPSVTRNLFADMDMALKAVSNYTHYYPDHWKGRGWDHEVRSQFSILFDSKVKLFLWELISLILAPYILIVKLPGKASEICEFCMMVKSKMPNAGDVCGYSTFNFDLFKDAAWEGRTMGSSMVSEALSRESLAESIIRTGNLDEATQNHQKPGALNGKMEKSFFSFQAAHPSWKCGPSGQCIVDRVEDYRRMEIESLVRERNLYVNAATRQLETLTGIERKGTNLKLEREVVDTLIKPATETPSQPHTETGSHLSPSRQSSLQNSTGGLSTNEQALDENLASQQAPWMDRVQNDHRELRSSILRYKASDELSQLFKVNERNLMSAVLPSDVHGEQSRFNASPQQQYYWLERFHAHLEHQRNEASSMALSVHNRIDQNLGTPRFAQSMPSLGTRESGEPRQSDYRRGEEPANPSTFTNNHK